MLSVDKILLGLDLTNSDEEQVSNTEGSYYDNYSHEYVPMKKDSRSILTISSSVIMLPKS